MNANILPSSESPSTTPACLARRNYTWLCLTFIALLALCHPSQAEPCNPGYRVVNVNPLDTGVTVYGPVCVKVPFNVLRYQAEIAFQFADGTPIDLTSIFPSGSGDQSLPSHRDAAAYLQAIDDWIVDKKKDFDPHTQANDNALIKAKAAMADISTVVLLSDVTYMQSNGAQAILNQISGLKVEIEQAKAAGYKPLKGYVEIFTNMQNELKKFENDNPALEDALKKKLTDDLTQVGNMLATAQAYLPDSANTKTYRVFLFWYYRISDISTGGLESFYIPRNAPCHVISNKPKTIGVTLSQIDLSPYLTGADPKPVAAAASPLVTVNCPSPFSISGGMGISFVPTRSYGLIPTTTAATAFDYGVIKTTDQSAMPIAMMHARLYNYRSTALQAGFGVAAHTQDDSAGGTGSEYLFGLGVSLLRTIYITPGWHYGRTASLAPGYSIGQTAASGVTSAPIVNGYSSGFGLAITFTKP